MTKAITNIDFKWWAGEVFARINMKPTPKKLEQMSRELKYIHGLGYKDCIRHKDSLREMGVGCNMWGMNNEE